MGYIIADKRETYFEPPCKHCSSEEKIRIMLKGLCRECIIAEFCRRKGINANLYHRWSKEFLDAGKKWRTSYTVWQTTTDKIKNLCGQAGDWINCGKQTLPTPRWWSGIDLWSTRSYWTLIVYPLSYSNIVSDLSVTTTTSAIANLWITRHLIT
jgi:hypothetical protein